MGTQASRPVQTRAIAGKGTGHHGSVLNSAGSVVTGAVRHAGIRAATPAATTPTHHGARATTRPALSVFESTATVPAAHQTEAPMIMGPANVR